MLLSNIWDVLTPVLYIGSNPAQCGQKIGTLIIETPSSFFELHAVAAGCSKSRKKGHLLRFHHTLPPLLVDVQVSYLFKFAGHAVRWIHTWCWVHRSCVCPQQWILWQAIRPATRHRGRVQRILSQPTGWSAQDINNYVYWIVSQFIGGQSEEPESAGTIITDRG